MNNQLEKVELGKGTQYQVQLVNQVDKATQEMGQEFTPYGRTCVINGIVNLIMYCKQNNIKFETIDNTMVKGALINLGFTELNFSATPAEAFFDLRKTTFYNGDKAYDGYTIAVRPQGAGYEKLTRRFGVNVKELKTCILVREGDEYTLPGFDGEKMTPFKWTPKSLDKKVIMVVYPLLKNDGTYEYLMATREGIKPNIIAQIRQNNLYTFKKKDEKGKWVVDTEARDAFYEEINQKFESMKVDEILADPRWRKELTPTYTSGGSREAMVIRKMKNNALNQYPREFSNSYIRAAVESMYEDRDDSLINKDNAIDVDPIQQVEAEINEEPQGDAVKDFKVSENGELEEPKIVQSPVEPNNQQVPPQKDNYDEDL